MKDTAGHYLLFNAAAERVTGKRAADVLGKDDRFLFPPDEADMVMGGDRAVMDGAESTTYEETVTDATGKRSTFLSTKGPIFDNDGELLGLFGIARDISERRRAEEQVLESRTCLQATLDSAGEGILAVDNSGRIVEANRRFAELWRVPGDLLASKDEEALLAFVMDQLADPEAFLGKIRSLRGSDATDADTLTFKDGRVFECHTSATMQGPVVTGRVWSFDDITERVAVERELRSSEERFRIAAETANDVVYEWDLEQRVQWWGKIDEMLGYEPDEFPRTLDGWASAVHPEDLERTMAQVQAHLESGDPYDAEYRVRRKDGVYRWWSARGAAARTPDGTPLRWIGSITDVTERKRGEAELRETRDYLENLFGYANAPVIVWDPELCITRFNRAFEELTQRAASEVVGRHLELLFPEDDRRREALAHVTQASAGERWQVVEIPILRADGEVRTVLWNSATVYAADGATPVATIAQGQDVTERKRAEGELRESESRFRQLADSLPQLVWTCVPDGPCDFLSRRWVAYTGIPQASQLGFGWLEQVHPDDRAATVAAWEAAVDAGTDFRVEFRLRRHDG